MSWCDVTIIQWPCLNQAPLLLHLVIKVKYHYNKGFAVKRYIGHFSFFFKYLMRQKTVVGFACEIEWTHFTNLTSDLRHLCNNSFEKMIHQYCKCQNCFKLAKISNSVPHVWWQGDGPITHALRPRVWIKSSHTMLISMKNWEGWMCNTWPKG